MNTLPPGLLLITDRGQAVRPLVEICEAALQAGFVGVMVREKDLPGGPLYDLSLPIADLCQDLEKLCLINDRLDVALALPGVGAHVGKQGMPVADARRLLGAGRALGYSAHEAAEAARALTDGANHVTLSPVFPSRSKPGLEPRGATWLAQGVASLAPGQVVGLGGIEVSNLGEVRTTGVHGAAVMGEMMRSEAPAKMAAEFVAAWGDRSRG
jgi:thiamine-phosphate pyrophosphorylase